MSELLHRVPVDVTRQEIRAMFKRWEIEDWEVVWDDMGKERYGLSKPGVRVEYWRNGVKQMVTCKTQRTRAENLRSCYFLMDRLRIAEQKGVQYYGLTSSKEVAINGEPPAEDKGETLADAYDILGVSPEDPIDLVKGVYKKKVSFYHPDVGGDQERFKAVQKAYETICQARGVTP
ncbi:MAG: J domain-containing protein [Dehalococcoidia bacterium]|nr:J domain-containing protein [Dehalococcoidia bacterium]